MVCNAGWQVVLACRSLDRGRQAALVGVTHALMTLQACSPLTQDGHRKWQAHQTQAQEKAQAQAASPAAGCLRSSSWT